MRGPFTQMTELPEFEEIPRDWLERSRTQAMSALRTSIRGDADLMVAVRNMGYLAGTLDTLDSFMSYIQKRLKSETPETPHALRKV